MGERSVASSRASHVLYLAEDTGDNGSAQNCFPGNQRQFGNDLPEN